ncbi:MAG TPA: hypothetical protein VG104_01770 [Candidatus Dormibacteraeota bacterium]|jgi:hypothetical protein|nr:hypothetical protein [Candidatus Dormibacteraeota bacterium]
MGMVGGVRMPATVRAAHAILTLHGLALIWPLVFVLIDPSSGFLLGPDGNTLARVFVVPPAFFGGLIVVTGTTGLPFWSIARPIAIGLELVCVPLGWMMLGAAGTGMVSVSAEVRELLNGPLGLALASVPALACLVLLTRPSASVWFRFLRRSSAKPS